MIKRVCSWQGCKTVVSVDVSLENSDVGKRMGITVGGWCPDHSKLYHNRCDAFTSLLDTWNKKQLRDKFNRIIKFTHHSELSNYLYQHDRKEYNRITKTCQK